MTFGGATPKMLGPHQCNRKVYQQIAGDTAAKLCLTMNKWKYTEPRLSKEATNRCRYLGSEQRKHQEPTGSETNCCCWPFSGIPRQVLFMILILSMLGFQNPCYVSSKHCFHMHARLHGISKTAGRVAQHVFFGNKACFQRGGFQSMGVPQIIQVIRPISNKTMTWC